MSRLVLKDELLDAQTLRTVGTAPYGGADIGECLAAARAIKPDLTSWYDSWSSLAARTLDLAEREESAGRFESARLAYFRASNYFRTAGVMLMGSPVDQRLLGSNIRQAEAFRQGASLLPYPVEAVSIPYEGTTLPGYFFHATTEQDARPLMVLTGGYDGTCEELYFLNGAAALARGYHVLVFDGPGQGAALLQQGLVLRPDWDRVITPVIDYAHSRPEVDRYEIALMGLSLGGHLAPRAASGEHRIAACIADCGSYDLFQMALQRIPGPLASGFLEGRRFSTALLRRFLGSLAEKPITGWGLRRGMLVHGADDPLSYIEALRDYSLKDHAAEIRCPTFVCNAENDDISASAPQLVEALNCDKEYRLFTAAEGAGDHCEAGARTLFHVYAFDWLDRILHR